MSRAKLQPGQRVANQRQAGQTISPAGQQTGLQLKQVLDEAGQRPVEKRLSMETG